MLQELLQDKPNELHKKNIEANIREIETKALEEMINSLYLFPKMTIIVL